MSAFEGITAVPATESYLQTGQGTIPRWVTPGLPAMGSCDKLVISSLETTVIVLSLGLCEFVLFDFVQFDEETEHRFD